MLSTRIDNPFSAPPPTPPSAAPPTASKEARDRARDERLRAIEDERDRALAENARAKSAVLVKAEHATAAEHARFAAEHRAAVVDVRRDVMETLGPLFETLGDHGAGRVNDDSFATAERLITAFGAMEEKSHRVLGVQLSHEDVSCALVEPLDVTSSDRPHGCDQGLHPSHTVLTLLLGELRRSKPSAVHVYEHARRAVSAARTHRAVLAISHPLAANGGPREAL